MRILYKESLTIPAKWAANIYAVRFDQLNERFFDTVKVMALCLMLSLQFKVGAQCTTCTNGTTTTNSNVTITSGQFKCINYTGSYSSNIAITSGTLCMGSGVTWPNSGNLSFSGTCTITVNGSSSKTISVPSGTTLVNNGAMSGSVTVAAGGTFKNYGTFTGSFTQSGGTVTNYSGGTFNPSSGNYTSGTLTNNLGGSMSLGNPTISNGYTLINNGTITIGSLTINVGATVTLTGTTQTLTSFINNGTFTYDGPGTISGGVSQNSGGVMNLSGGVTVNGSFSNNGTVNLSGTLTVGGAFSQNSGASIVASDNSGCNSVTMNSTVTNGGTFNGNNNGLSIFPTISCASCLTNGAVTGATTAPTVQPTSLSLTYLSSSSLRLNYTAATTQPTGYIILRYIGSSASTCVPTNFSDYSVGDAVGTCTIAGFATGNSTTFTDNNIPSGNCGKNIYYRIFSYNGGGMCAKYMTSSPLAGSIAIPAAPTLSIASTISCYGAATGTATVTATGTSSPYTYAWSSGATTLTATGLAAGTYTVTVTSYYGCTVSASKTVTQPAAGITASTVATGTCGNAKGSVDLFLNGATAPYTYSWSNGSSSQNLGNVSAGTYNVTVTDINSCTTTASGTVLTAPKVTLSMASTNVSCFGGTDGEADLTINSGTAPYTYSWSNGASTQDLSGVAAGTYNVTVTDVANCTASASKPITQPTAISASISGTNVTVCYGNSNGAATLTRSGGTGSYTYLWSNGATTQNLSSIAAGTYSVTITDANSCTATASVTITQPASMVLTLTPTSVTCNGGTNGSATLIATGSTSPYTYSWSSGAITQNITSRTAGTYTVTVTSNTGCTASNSVTITQPAVVSGSIIATNVSCYGTLTGAATVTPSGGTAPYTYLWSTGATTQNISGKAPGTYTVTITSTGVCTGTASVTITQPSAALSATIGATNVPCYGTSTGGANAIVSGGTSPYTYSWTGGAITQSISNKPIGTYNVTVTDNRSCTTTASVTLTQPASAVSVTTAKTDLVCNGVPTGAVTSTPAGGTTPYTYAWSNSATTQNNTGVLAGTHTVTVTDARGCTVSSSKTLTQPTAITHTSTTTLSTCGWCVDGALDLTASGGTGTLTYLWSNGATTQDLTGVASDIYTCTITDGNSCTVTHTDTVFAPISVSIAGNSACTSNGGSAVASGSGGTPPYTYRWNNGSTSATRTSLVSGTYTVTVTDAAAATATNSVVISNSNIIATVTTSSATTCAGTSVTLTASGSNNYSWTPSASLSNANIASPVATPTVTTTYTVAATQPTTNLVTNGNFSSGNTGFSSDYVYVSPAANAAAGGAGLTPEGDYAVGTSATTYKPNWICLDHTTGTGNFMIINGAPVADAIMWQQTVLVNQNMDYNFSTWVANVNTYNPALLRFAINGVLIGDSILAPVTQGDWLQYSTTWNSGSNSSAVISIVNENTILGGNDFGLDDISFTTTCTNSNAGSVTVTVYPKPDATAVTTNIACYGNATGAVDLSVSSGTSPFTYLWTGGATTQDISSKPAGTYSVTVSDAHACKDTFATTLTQPTAALNTTIAATNVLCSGAATGAATANPTGGTSPYTYLWTGGATTKTITGKVAGTYSVTVTDANNCSISASVTLTQPTVLSSSIVGTNITCNGGTNGAAALTVSGGTSSYTYSWTGGATTQNLASKTAGTYTVTVTDANSCTTTSSVTLTQPAAVTGSIVATNVTCNGGTTGAGTLTPLGGTPTYTYLWTGGATTQNISAKAAGTYSVTITDSRSCTGTASVTITQPAAVSGSIVATNINCNGASTGAATLTPAGGTSPYTYLWTGGATTQNISNKVAGTYSVTISDANSCTGTASVTLTQPAAVTGSIVATNINCNGGSTGAATLTPAGGTGAYTYLWTGGATTQNLSGKAAGTYSVTITDANSCTGTASVTLTQAAAIVPTITGTNLTCNGSANGSATLSTTGGTGAYTYLWTGGATTQNISGKAAGTYSVTVTDVNSCTATSSVTLTQPAVVSGSIVATNVACYGNSTGAATLTPAGGTAPYTYSWTGGAITQNLTAKAAGTYTVTITSVGGCTGTASVTITQPTALSGSIAGTNITCNGGTNGAGTLTVSGGTSGYTYLWTGGATTQNIASKAAGTYSVTITDANSCTATTSVTLTQPAAVSGSIVGTNINCNGGSTGAATLTPAGGTGAYTYLWTGGATTQNLSGKVAGTYSVTITDANSCTGTASVTLTQAAAIVPTITGTNLTCNGSANGSATLSTTGGTGAYTYLWTGGATTQNISGKAAGTYSVTVTDVNSCTATSSVTLTQPAVVSGSIVATNVACYGNSTGAATLTPAGGTSPYTYSWTGGAITQNLTAKAAGTYTVTISDSRSCTGTASVTITQPAAALSGSIAGTNITCNGGTNGAGTLTVSGGTAGYTYLWTGGATTQNIASKAAGTYSVTITDVNSCTATTSVTLTQPAAVSGSIVGTNINCNGGSTGAATLTPAGGTGAYTYLWTGGATTQNLSGKVAGTYSVTITDANSCTGTASVTLTQAAAIVPTITGTNLTCNGSANGSATLSTTGGTGAYTYLWTGGATTQNITSKAAGTYSVTVTDVNSCTATSSVTLTQPAVVSGSIVATNVACYGNSTGAATLTPAGGTAPYTYSWTGGAITQNLTAKAAGTYTVTISDSRSCTGTASVTITQPAAALSGSIVNTNLLCNGATNGAATLTVSGGTSGYTYLWTGGAITQNLTNKAAGTYSVTITDARSCTAITSTTLTQPTPVTGSISATNVSCNGQSNGAATLTPSGGTGAYTYLWTGGATTQNISSKAAGTYSVTITDANSCTGTTSVTLTQPAVLTASATNTNNGCNGGSSATATLTVGGGTTPYTYSWSNGAITQNLTGLAAGTYSVTVTDAHFCTATTSVTVVNSSALVATIAGTNVSCNGGNNGAANLTVTGGPGGVQAYSWSNGSIFQDLSSLTAGTYTVTVSIFLTSSCTATASVTISQPAAMTASIVGTNPTCNGGTNGAATLTPGGGTSPYTYSWTGGAITQNLSGKAAGTYSVTVTDANSCTKTGSVTLTAPTALSGSIVATNVSCNGGSNGATTLTPAGGTSPYTYSWTGGAITQNISGKTAGTYSVTITDANSCTGTASTTLTQPTAVSGSIVATNVSCNGGTNGAATLTASGGTSPYTYAWTGGAITQNLTGKAAGTYSVTISDANSCTGTASVTITQPAVLTGSIVGTNINCNGASTGAATLTVSGGTSPYTYSWSGGAITQNISGKAAGTYSVTITATGGCTTTASVTLTQNTAVTGSIVSTNVSCNGGANGAATLTASGGTAPYTYAWTGSITTQNLSGKAAGTYSVTITDANSCTGTTSTTLTQPAAITASFTTTNVSCNGQSNGSTTVTPSGGTPSYTYLWTGGSTSSSIIGKAAGTYNVTITDSRSCTGTSSVTITQPTVLSASAVATNKSKTNVNDGTVTLTVSGGTTSYTYLWSNGAATQNLTALASATYTVTVTDAHGCTATASATVTNPTGPCTCIATGVWTNATTWSGNCSGGGGNYAGYLDNITIQGYRVTVDSAHTVKSLILRESTIDTTKLLFTATNSLNIIDSFGLNTISAGKDIELDIDGSAKMTINGDFNIVHSNGNNINVYLNSISGTSAKLKVLGNLNMTLNSGGKNILMQAGGSSDTIQVVGNINMINNNGTSTKTEKIIVNQGRLLANNNINFLPVRDGNTEIQVNNNATVELKGDMTRPASPSKFGKFTAGGNGNLMLNGTAQQTLHSNGGSGSDAFTYKDMIFNNSYATSPQIVLDGTVTVADSIIFMTGKVSTGSTDSLILTNTASGAISGHNNNSYVIGYLTRYIAMNSSSYDFPVGLSGTNKYFLATIKNHNMIGPSKLTATFMTLPVADQGTLHIALTDMTVTRMNTAGLWNIEPDVQPLLGSYDINLSTTNHKGLYDNFFVPIKRPKNASASSFGLGSVLNGLTSSVLGAWGTVTRLVSTGYTSMNNMTAFSDFGIGESGSGSLPITLLSFSATPTKQATVNVNWVTAQEINNDYFTVERSVDGEVFDEVTRVKGSGNSSITLNYSSIDEKPFTGLSYYRLKQTDFDGQFTYSDIVSVTVMTAPKVDFSIYPNPNKGSFSVRIDSPDKIIKITVVNSLGQVIQADEISNAGGQSVASIRLNEPIASGIYFVKIDSGEDTFIKQMIIE